LNGLNRQFRVDVLDYGANTAMPKVETFNTPTTKTQYQTTQGTINLVNNNPISVVGSQTKGNDWSAFDGIVDEPLRNNQHFMFYASNLPKVKNVQTIGNYCPEIYRGEYTDNLGAFSIVHVNACGKVYTYMNKQAMYVMKGNLINAGGNTVLMGALLSLTGVGLAPSAVLTAGVVASLSNLNTSIDTCINRGGNSAWMNTAVGVVPLNVSCSF
jgi:hypothetical protein